MTTRLVRAKLRASLATTAATALLLVGIVRPATIEPTDASWTGKDLASASFSAATIPAPVLTQPCEFRPGVLGLAARVRIYWQLPEGYELGDIVVEASTSGLGSVLAPLTGFSVLSNTTARDDGTYRTTVPTNLLGGLLGLGSEMGGVLGLWSLLCDRRCSWCLPGLCGSFHRYVRPVRVQYRVRRYSVSRSSSSRRISSASWGAPVV